MLPLLRKHIKLTIWIIVLCFAVWGAGSIAVSQEKTASYAGKVFGEKISHKEFLTMLRFYDLLTRASHNSTNTKQQDSAAEEKKTQDVKKPKPHPKTESEQQTPASEPPSYDQLRGMSWQTIALSREAKHRQIKVSDTEVATEIQRLFSGTESFNEEFYERWVEANLKTRPREFEEAVRMHLTVQKLREDLLKNIPEKEHGGRWLQELINIMSRARIEDYTAEAKK